MSNFNAFFHESSEFSENQFANAKEEKKIIQQIYNKFDENKLNGNKIKIKYLILGYDAEVFSIGEESHLPNALKSYTRKYIPKLTKYMYEDNNSLLKINEILLSPKDTKIIPAYINSQYIGDLGQDQFYHIARQCYLINLVYQHFIADSEFSTKGDKETESEINDIKKTIENSDTENKIIILLNDCKLKLSKPNQKIKQGFDAVIDETNHYLKKIIENKNIILISYHKNYIDESVLIDQIINESKFKLDKKLKEHFKNDMLLLNNKTIQDEKEEFTTDDWNTHFVFPPELLDFNDDNCDLKKVNNLSNNIKALELYNSTSEGIRKLFFYCKLRNDDIFYKIEFCIPDKIFNDQVYIDVINISKQLLNESVNLK